MRPVKWVCGLLSLVCGSTLHADTIFNLSGAFQSGSTFTDGSSITIDSDLGTVTNLNIGISAPDSVFFTFASGVLVVPPEPANLHLVIGNNLPVLDLFLPITTLVGYTGGGLCFQDDGVCPTASFLAPVGARDILTSGSLTPAVGVTPVPEPLSLALVALGFVGIASYIVTRKFALRR